MILQLQITDDTRLHFKNRLLGFECKRVGEQWMPTKYKSPLMAQFKQRVFWNRKTIHDNYCGFYRKETRCSWSSIWGIGAANYFQGIIPASLQLCMNINCTFKTNICQILCSRFILSKATPFFSLLLAHQSLKKSHFSEIHLEMLLSIIKESISGG